MEINPRSKTLRIWLEQSYGRGRFLSVKDGHDYVESLMKTDIEMVERVVTSFGGFDVVEAKIFGAPIMHMVSRGYAPGGYSGTCSKCTDEMIAAKRAITCRACAVYDYRSNK